MKSLIIQKFKFSLLFIACVSTSVAYSQTSFLWAKGIGTTGVDQGTKVKVDAAGNVYTVGFYIGTADFNPGAGVFNMSSNTATWYDVFVTKFDASGNFVWAKSIGGSLNDVPLSLELDNANNLLICGYFSGTVDFDPNAGIVNLVSAGNEEPFILKLTDQGNFVWARRLGGTQNEYANGVAIDNNDNVYVTGVFSIAGDYDPGAATYTLTPVGSQDCFIVKLNSAGVFVWAKQIGGTGNEVGKSIDIDGANNVITTGNFTLTADFDPGAGVANSTSLGQNDMFINKLDQDGNFIFNKTIGGTSEDFLTTVKTDGNNNIVAVGYFAGAIDVDPGAGTTTYTSLGGNDGVLIKLNSAGDLVWSYHLGSSAGENYQDLAFDINNNIYTVGVFSGGIIDFDPGVGTFSMASSGFEDGFIQKLTAAGSFVSAWRLGGSNNNDRAYGVGVSTNALAEIHTTGSFSSSADMDPSAGVFTLNPVGSSDIFVQKMGCATPAAPTGTASPSICANNSVVLTANGVGTLGWYTAASGGTYLGGGTSYNTGNLTTTTTYYVQDSTCVSGPRTAVTVTVNPMPIDQLVTPVNANICSGGNATITVGNTESNVYYSLVNDGNNAVVMGPTQGTGSALNFNLTGITATTTYHVKANKPTTYDGALDFDGTNDYVTMGTNNRGITSTITVSARVRTTVTGTSQFVVSKYLSASLGYYLVITGTGHASFQGRDVAGTIKSSGNSTTMVADNQWHELTGVVRNTGWEIWVDGVLQSSGAYTLGATGLGTSATLQAGQFNSGGYFPGQIDELTIWNTALSPAQILANTSTCLLGNEANLTGYFKFNEVAGTVATDFSTTAINGTLTSMTPPGCWVTAPINACSQSCDLELSQLSTVTVTPAPAQPTISTSGSTALCSGGSVTLTSSAGTSYLWSNGATTPSIVVNAAGTYTVQVTNAAGCQSVASTGTTVTVGTPPATPTISAGGPTTFCAGGSVTLTSSTGTSYLWSNGATTAAISPTTSGTYTVQITNASGCQSAASSGTTVTVNALPGTPTINASGPTTFCAGGSVTLTSTAGTSYLWSNGATTSSINATTAGIYTVQVTNAAGCQSVTSAGTTVTVNALPSTPTINAGGPTTFCAGGSVTLTSSAGSSYLWSNGATTASINATVAGTYTVQVTNAAACQSPASIGTTVTVNALPTTPTINAGGPTTFCAGGSVTLTSSAGTSYLWSNGATTASISPTAVGTYTVQVTNAAGCQSAASAGTTVTVNALPATPTITPSGPTTFCAGGSVTLSAPASSSYLWSDGSMSQSINPGAGTYTLQVTNAAGCQSAASAPVTVTVNALPTTPTINAGGPTTFCDGGSVTLTSSAGTSYLWSTGATTASISPTISGTYTVQVTNASGCQSTASAGTTVVVNALPTISQGTALNPTSCTIANGSIQVNGSGTGTISWSGTASGSLTGVTLPATIPSLGDGAYLITFTNASSCVSNTLSVSLTAPSAPATPTITPGGATTFCEGGSVTLTSSTGTTYLWSNGATTPSINATTAGNYSVSITDANGCSSLNSVSSTVTVMPLPLISSGTIVDPTSCLVSDGSIEVSGSGMGDLTWSGVSSGSQIGINLPATITNLGQGSYILNFTDGNGCESSDLLITLNAPGAPAAPSISANGPLTFCEGESVVLSSSNGDIYLWSNSEATQSITVNTSGTYSLTITDVNGCVSPSSTPVTVTVDPMPDLSVSVSANVLSAAQNGASYQWVDCNNANAPIAGATNQTFAPTANGSYACEITMGSCTNLTNCETISTIGLMENSKEMIAVFPNPTTSTIQIQSSDVIENTTIFDMRGNLVLQFAGNSTSVEQLECGMYLISVKTEKGLYQSKFVKQ